MIEEITTRRRMAWMKTSDRKEITEVVDFLTSDDLCSVNRRINDEVDKTFLMILFYCVTLQKISFMFKFLNVSMTIPSLI